MGGGLTKRAAVNPGEAETREWKGAGLTTTVAEAADRITAANSMAVPAISWP